MNETENPLLENSQSPKNPEKTLIINSVNNYDNKKEILQKVDDFFEDENKYLNLEEKIYVGKKPQGPIIWYLWVILEQVRPQLPRYLAKSILPLGSFPAIKKEDFCSVLPQIL